MNKFANWFCLAVVCGLVLGCSEESPTPAKPAAHDHDHDHGPATLKDAVAELTGMRDVIRDAFAANNGDAAHDSLHDVGHVLEAFEALAEKEKVSPENAAIIKTSVESLFTNFGDVDKTMHGQEGKTYSEVSKDIDAAITALATACGVTSSAVAEATEPAAEAPAEPAAEEPKKDE